MSRARTTVIAGLGVMSLALAGCASQTPATGTATGAGQAKAGGVIRVAETNAFTSFNTNQAQGNLDINGKVVEATRSNWFYIDNKLQLVKDTSFGTMEKVSAEPLTVKYTIKDGVTWSDGNAVDKGDMLLQWAAASGHFDAKGTGAQPKFFQYAGSTAGLGLTSKPTFDNDRTMTLTYSKPYVDWEIAFSLGRATPAHVVAKRAGMDEAALVEVLKSATPGQANDKLAAIAKVWNEDFAHKSLPSDPSLYLSSGPMVVKEMVADQSITLKRNDKYTGERKANVDEITVRFIGDASAQIAALRNGEVDIIAPQPSTDTVAQAKALPNVGVMEGARLSYDHLDLSFDAEVFKDPVVRKAFLLTVPRQQIVDRLIKPMYADAKVVDSQLYLPSEGEDYTKSVAANGSSAYAQVDIAKAKELLAGRTPTVRVLYASNNPIRVDAFSMIRESATQAGFKVEDAGATDWGSRLGKGGYDAALFGWISSGVGNAGVPQIFKSGQGGNYNAYASAEVDRLADELMVEVDGAKAEEIKRKIDAQLFKDAYGLTLFQGPGLVAHSKQIQGLEYMPNQTGVWWNFWKWSLS